MIDAYLRFPSIASDTVVFVAEDDVWSVPAGGGDARRLTADLADVEHPALSADGSLVAFTSTSEGGPEVYVQPTAGGTARRLTYLGDPMTLVRGFTPDGQVVFTSAAGLPFSRRTGGFTVPVTGGPVQRLPYGPVAGIAYGPGGGVLLGRNTGDPARWKRYRGGMAGRLWIDPDGSGTFHRLLADLDGNIGSPLWVGDRIWFLSDHEGIGNLYSCPPAGDEVTRHTAHATFYARWAASDGTRVVYQHAGEIWCYDPAADSAGRIDVRLGGPRTQRARRFVDAGSHLGSAELHPAGHSVVADVRGKLVTFGAWEGAVRQYGEPQGVRYRLGSYLPAGKDGGEDSGGRIAVVSDADGEDGIDVFATAGEPPRRLAAGALGRVVELAASPDGGTLAVANHRRELVTVALADGAVRVLDTAPAGRINGVAWSPDGAWLAYAAPVSEQISVIRLAHLATGAVHPVTTGRFFDAAPSFDPKGRFLYFLSWRTYEPVADGVQTDYAFPKAARPYLVTLRRDLLSPFIPTPRPLKDEPVPPKEEARREGEAEQAPPAVTVDLEGIADRVVAFPVDAERYQQVLGLDEDKVLLRWHPLERRPRRGEELRTGSTLAAYDLTARELKVLSDSAGPVTVSADRSTMLYRAQDRLRVLRAGVEDPKDAPEGTNRESGWLDLDRLRVAVDPGAEWPQMLAEAWRLQRDHFWVADMSGVDWDGMLARYRPLAERVSTRAEFSDLMWEFQGELGTSHAYEMGGDYRPTASWPVGHLGADLRRDDGGRWRVEHVVVGDSWDADATSPLAGPGVNVGPGDALLAVNGQPVDPESGPGPLLVHQAGQPVALRIASADGGEPREVTVTTLAGERSARYREWVERNRARVLEATDGRVGYLHVPDMSTDGFAEFHRYYLAEFERDALVVDVRCNGGGHVSSLLLQKLARRPLGYDLSRWGVPSSYPYESPAGPMVCLTDEQAGSDGDMFTHAFKLLGLGPVIGLRTWGGVIGISPSVELADGTTVTQPEYAFWFTDVGWGLENHGAEPDIERDIAPHEYAAGEDPQLDLAVETVLERLAGHHPARPDLATRPPLPRPALPTPPG